MYNIGDKYLTIKFAIMWVTSVVVGGSIGGFLVHKLAKVWELLHAY